MSEKKIKIFLVDDHKIFVRGVASLLGTEQNFDVIGFASSGLETLNFIKDIEPDLIITDIQMPGMDGIELTTKIKESYPQIKVIGLSMLDKPEIIKDLIDAGADGYLLKDIEKSELVLAINEVNSGNFYYSGSIAQTLMKSLSNRELLTKREKEIINLIAQEQTNAQIADKLFISERTVESHRKNIFRKTNVKSVVGLIKYAYDNMII
jgi:two-component system, NarL family, nitrate/nitrite response regulator NarL